MNEGLNSLIERLKKSSPNTQFHYPHGKGSGSSSFSAVGDTLRADISEIGDKPRYSLKVYRLTGKVDKFHQLRYEFSAEQTLEFFATDWEERAGADLALQIAEHEISSEEDG